MPFDPNNPPSKLKNLSDKKKRQWVHVFNSCYEKSPDEKKCHMQAWGTVKKSASDDESFMGCGCTQVGDCGCSHSNSKLPTASERIVREIRHAMQIRIALKCYGQE
jgi:hypothetical protein